MYSSKFFFTVCTSCIAKLKPITGQRRCKVCSINLVSESEICTHCREREYAFGANYSLFAYQGMIKELIYQFKFKNRKRVALVLAHFLSKELIERFRNIAVIPVPARKSTLRKRGWDHMEAISRILENDYSIHIYRFLERKGDIPQKALSYNQRIQNIRETIFIRKKRIFNMEHALLLDDIFTTGATVSECARVLRGEGINRVDVLTLAID